MLYMKTRVTFRVGSDLAEALREMPNQTAFVEQALRSALGRTCPACSGKGRVPWSKVSVSDFKEAALPRLDHDGAIQLRGLVQLARELAASEVDLGEGENGFAFTVRRGEDVLMRGTLKGRVTTLAPN
jgi:hypothetical protein